SPVDQGQRGGENRRHGDTEGDDARVDVMVRLPGACSSFHVREENSEQDQEEKGQGECEEEGRTVPDEAFGDGQGDLLEGDHDRYSLPVSSRKTSSREAARIR